MLLTKAQALERIKIDPLAVVKVILSKTKSSQQGITIIESLVAIAVISVVIASFTPPIFLAVATRIQNRRAEQALQLAQGEVDRVRRIVEIGDYVDFTSSSTNPNRLPPVGAVDVTRQGAPSGFTNNPTAISASTGLQVDVNGDGTFDFVVQTYRSPGIIRDGKTVAFKLGVRVYTFNAIQDPSQLEPVPTRAASLQLSTAVGQQRKRPLAMMYTSVVQSDNRNSLSNYSEFLEGPPLP